MAAQRGETPDLEQVILGLLGRRAAGASICPSDAARAAQPQGWRALMDEVRSAAARLADRGEVEVTQRGRKVDVGTARGPIRIRFPELPLAPPDGPVDEPDVVLAAGPVLGLVVGRLTHRVVRMPHREDDHQSGQTSWTQPDSPRRRASWRAVMDWPHFSQVLPPARARPGFPGQRGRAR
jgi:hypothetical protein